MQWAGKKREKGAEGPPLVFVNKVLLGRRPFAYTASLVAFVLTVELKSYERL